MTSGSTTEVEIPQMRGLSIIVKPIRLRQQRTREDSNWLVINDFIWYFRSKKHPIVQQIATKVLMIVALSLLQILEMDLKSGTRINLKQKQEFLEVQMEYLVQVMMGQDMS